ncbi:hypothetical protein C0J52_03963 [Blattella germanica]|nr:hypothetical protein C0J52_03963 [Blattella germanica]
MLPHASERQAARSSIRTLLRHNVEIEHPELKTKKRRHPKKKTFKKRSLRRLVIPIFEESDNDEFVAADSDDEDGERDVGRASVIYDVQRQRAGQITAVIELARSLAGHRRSVRVQQPQRQHNHQQQENQQEHQQVQPQQNLSNLQEKEDEGMEEAVDVEEFESASAEGKDAVEDKSLEETAPASSTTIAEQRKKIPKREKFDSGIGDEIENGKGLSSDSDRDEDGSFMEVDSDSDFSDPVSSAGKRTNRSFGNEEKAPSQRDESSSQSTEAFRRSFGERRARNLARNMAKEAMLWRNLAFGADEESDEKSEEEMQDSATNMEVHNISTVEVDSYTTYMRSKIQALPLPPSLKAYINLYREF